MTDLHAMAEEASQEIQAPTYDGVDYAVIIERALAKLQAEHEAERTAAAVAEALERAAQIIRHEAKGWDKQGDVARANAILALLPAICALSTDAGEKVLIDKCALRVIEAAKVLTPLLEEGWDDQDTPDDQNIGARACDELIAATKALLAAAEAKEETVLVRGESIKIDDLLKSGGKA